jgi:hypothetical protein
MFIKILLKLPSTLKAISSTDYLYLCRLAASFNKLSKFAANNVAGTNTHWASPNNVRICPLAKRYVLNDVKGNIVVEI